MKILIDARILEYNIRGMGFFVKHIVERISKIDNTNIYILLIKNKKNLKTKINVGKNFEYYNSNLPIGLNDIFFIPFVINFIIKPDVVWFPANNCSPFIKKNIKVISTIHDIMFFTQNYKLFSKQYFGALYRKIFSKIAVNRADIINTLTLHDITLFSNFFNVGADKFFYTYEGANISEDEDNNILNRLNIKKYEYIYTISGTSPNKNLNFIIKAFEIFNSLINYKFKFVITGVNSGNIKINNPDIIFTDYITDAEKNSLLSNCNLFLFLSKDEGFGVPPIEAIYNNCKVLLSNIPNLIELYSGYAHFVDINNEENVAKKMVEILDKKINYNKDDLMKKFSWENAAITILNKMTEHN